MSVTRKLLPIAAVALAAGGFAGYTSAGTAAPVAHALTGWAVEPADAPPREKAAVRRSFVEDVQAGVVRIPYGGHLAKALGTVSFKVWGNARGLTLSATLRLESITPSGRIVVEHAGFYFPPFPVKNGFTYSRGVGAICNPGRRGVRPWRIAYAATLSTTRGMGSTAADAGPWTPLARC